MLLGGNGVLMLVKSACFLAGVAIIACLLTLFLELLLNFVICCFVSHQKYPLASH